jgi:hypothetical protein
MKYDKTISTFNGNGKRYTSLIPRLLIAKFGNDIAKRHFEKNTGLLLTEHAGMYTTQPKTFKQLYKVFKTYNWKTTYYDNASIKNTLKLEHNINN